jgi:hypothetical protein
MRAPGGMADLKDVMGRWQPWIPPKQVGRGGVGLGVCRVWGAVVRLVHGIPCAARASQVGAGVFEICGYRHLLTAAGRKYKKPVNRRHGRPEGRDGPLAGLDPTKAGAGVRGSQGCVWRACG